MNGLTLFFIILIIMVVTKYAKWTSEIHHQNMIIKQKIGEKTYDWLLED